MLRTTLVLLALAALAGLPSCSSRPTDPQRAARQDLVPPVSHDASGLVVRVEVSDPEIAPGEVTSIKVVVENPTDRDIVLGFSSGCYIMFVVTTADGTVLAPLRVACTTDAPVVTFAAHSSVVREFAWSGFESISGTYGDPLPAGEYEVSGGLSEPADVARSEPVPIRIVEP